MTSTQLLLLFAAGVGASLHCLGMCGAFALAAGRRRAWYSAFYTLGRLCSYGAIGAIVGAIGKPLWAMAALTGLQNVLTVILGVAMIALGLRLLGAIHWSAPLGALKGPRALVDAISTLMPPSSPTQALTLGTLNGLLPCPVVHAFLPVALAAGSLEAGAVSLLVIGLGTIPAMLALGFCGGIRGFRHFGHWMARGPGAVMFVFGFVTVARVGLLWFHK